MDGQINRINLKPPSASSSTRAVAEPRCPSCGDGMKGLRLLKCPECGKSVSATRPATSGPDAGELTQRAELQSALLILLIGAVGSAAFLTYDWGWQGAAYYGISLAISVPVGLAAYCLCCLLWVGFDEPLGMVAVKLAGIYAAVDLVSIVMNHIPILDIWIVRTAIAAATYISLLMSQLDLDQGDAIGVAFATFIVKLIIAWSLLAFLIPLLGLA